VNTTTTTLYTVRIFNDLGCGKSHDVLVTIQPRIPKNNDTTICRGDTVQMDATGGFAYRWTPSTGLSSDQIPNPLAYPDKTTSYLVEIVNKLGCMELDTITVTVLPPPSIKVIPKQTICKGDILEIWAASGSSGGSGTETLQYDWEPKEFLEGATRPNPFVFPEVTTLFTVRASNSDGCTTAGEVLVEVAPTPEILTNNAYVCRGKEITLVGEGINIDQYIWKLPDGTTITDDSITVRPNQTTTYTITGKSNSVTCDDEKTITVYVFEPTDEITFPTLPTIGENPLPTIEIGEFQCGVTCVTVVVNNPSDVEQFFVLQQASDSSAIANLEELADTITLAAGETSMEVCFAPASVGPFSGTLTFRSLPCEANYTVAYLGEYLQGGVVPSERSIVFPPLCSQELVDTTIVLTNTSSLPMEILTPNSDNAVFTVAAPTTFPLVVDSGETVSINIRFELGTSTDINHEGTISIPFTNTTCEDIIQVALRGIVGKAEILANTNFVTFPQLFGCEQKSTTTITITNTSDYALTITGTTPLQSFIATTQFPIILQANSTQDITLDFLPQGNGIFTEEIQFITTPCDNETVITLRGEKQGIALNIPEIVDLGKVATCEQQTLKRTINIENTSETPITIDRINSPISFVIDMQNGTIIPAGETRTLTIEYLPQTNVAQIDNGLITFESSPCDLRDTIQVSAEQTIVELEAPTLVQFGITTIGTPRTQERVWVNTGSSDLTIAAFQFTSNPNDIFSVTSTIPQLPATLSPGDTLRAVLTYAPEASTKDTAQAQIRVQVPCNQTFDVTLTGQGTTRAVGLSAVPIDFQGVYIDKSWSASTVLFNDTDEEIQITNWSISGIDQAAFSHSLQPIVLPSGASETITVTFSPTVEGSHEAELIGVVQAGAAENISVTLQGEGILTSMEIPATDFEYVLLS
jgi:hypothetical protein